MAAAEIGQRLTLPARYLSLPSVNNDQSPSIKHAALLGNSRLPYNLGCDAPRSSLKAGHTAVASRPKTLLSRLEDSQLAATSPAYCAVSGGHPESRSPTVTGNTTLGKLTLHSLSNVILELTGNLAFLSFLCRPICPVPAPSIQDTTSSPTRLPIRRTQSTSPIRGTPT